MSGQNAGMGSTGGDLLRAGFAKIQGIFFHYIMQTYEIIVGRNTKNEKVNMNLSAITGDEDISPRHARIFYDFEHHSFALEVLSQRGCYVRSLLYRQGDEPVKLKSQDLIQIGRTQLYFLLPDRSIFEIFAAQGTPHSFYFRDGFCHIGSTTASAQHTHIPSQHMSSSVTHPLHIGSTTASAQHTHIPSQPMSSSLTRHVHSDVSTSRGNGHGRANGGNEIVGTRTHGTFTVPINMSFVGLDTCSGSIKVELIGMPDEHAKKLETKMADKDEDNLQVLLKEENELISCVATLVSNHCNSSGRQWMPVAQLHAELIEHFSAIWPRSKVQQYLAPEDGSSTGTAEKPWHRLLELLKKYPEKFVVMGPISVGTGTSEFVSLVSLLRPLALP